MCRFDGDLRIVAANTISGLTEAGVLGLLGTAQGFAEQDIIQVHLQRCVKLSKVILRVLAGEKDQTAESGVMQLVTSKLSDDECSEVRSVLERVYLQAERCLKGAKPEDVEQDMRDLSRISRMLQDSLRRAAP